MILSIVKAIKTLVLKLLATLKFQLLTLWYAFRDPECPIYIKIVVFVVICYGLSPIDLIPDFIPILGYVDELIILPILIRIVEVLMPTTIMTRAKTYAFSHLENKKPKPKVWVGVLIILGVWVFAVTLLAHLLVPMLQEYASLYR